MAASNSRAPFLTYLTVFKARLGAANVVLGMTDFGYVPEVTLLRKLRAVLAERVAVEVDAPANMPVFQYLLDKKILGAAPRDGGRYPGVTLSIADGKPRWADRRGQPSRVAEVYRPDVWMASSDLPSTVGVPTPENANEMRELCVQLGLLSKAKCSWTAAGQLAHGLRRRQAALWGADENPLLLGLESVALLRQILAVDGLVIRELLATITKPEGATIRRDEVALRLPVVAAAALQQARVLGRPSPEIAEGKKFVELLVQTAQKRAGASRAPGVLEHRTAPRLEWLTDLGALGKDDMPRNGFEYVVRPDASRLLDALPAGEDPAAVADEGALAYWQTAESYAGLRARVPSLPVDRVLLAGERVRHADLVARLVALAAEVGGVTLSGGRYTRSPEMVHMADSVLAAP
jgi:hypothetical protein